MTHSVAVTAQKKRSQREQPRNIKIVFSLAKSNVFDAVECSRMRSHWICKAAVFLHEKDDVISAMEAIECD